MKKGLLFAFVVAIVGSCFISCSCQEERRGIYDNYTDEGGGSNVTFRGGQPQRYHCLVPNCPCTEFVDDNAGGCATCKYYGCSSNKYGHSQYKY